MPLSRRACLGLLGAGALTLSLRVRADLEEEVDFRLISPQPVADPRRIEVIEFFYYGCKWCYELEAYLGPWLQRKPADVAFRRVPALRNQKWLTLTRAYYALQTMALLERLHAPVFHAYHRDEINLESESQLFAWIARQGVSRVRFEEAFRSPRVEMLLHESRRLTNAYEIDTTPSLVVDGRYLTSSGMVGGLADLMTVVQGLVDYAREGRFIGK